MTNKQRRAALAAIERFNEELASWTPEQARAYLDSLSEGVEEGCLGVGPGNHSAIPEPPGG